MRSKWMQLVGGWTFGKHDRCLKHVSSAIEALGLNFDCKQLDDHAASDLPGDMI